MKIIVTVHQFLPDFSSGTEVIALGIAKELQHRGHEVTVVTGFHDRRAVPDAERFDSYVYDGLRVERFRHSPHPMGDQRGITELTYDNRLFARAFDALLAEIEPDVVHFVHLARLSASLIEPCVARGIPTVFTATDFWAVCPYSQLRLGPTTLCDGPDAGAFNCVRHLAANMAARQPTALGRNLSAAALASRAPDWMLDIGVRAAKARLPMAPAFLTEVRDLVGRQPFLREQLNRIDRVIAPSRIMERKLVGGGVEAERVEFLPYGIDVSRLTRDVRRGTGRTLRLGFTGSVAEHKGVEVALDAMRRLDPAIPVELEIYGATGDNPGYQAFYRHVQAAAAADPRIRLHPPFDNSRLDEVLGSFDVLLVPSLWHENTPLVVYEAFAAGCPVIASDVEGIAEVVRHGVDGLLFTPGDSAALAAHIERLAGDRDLLRRLAARARPPLSIPDHVTRLEAIYDEVMAVPVADEAMTIDLAGVVIAAPIHA
ncbi:MAG TPA: glycosyltransferase [Longimicrobium sp.]|jgi:glycosyltransferase involved in cell wall biosynthesis